MIPEVPREEEPIIATFKLNNPSSQPISTEYQFYANGKLMKEGATITPPVSSKLYQYAYQNPLLLGEQVNFMVRVNSPVGNSEKTVSLPTYPPQIWSSFVSFASFSTSMMGFISSMTYYQSSFSSGIAFNVGILVTIVLIPAIVVLLVLGDKLLLFFGRSYSESGAMLLRILALSVIPVTTNFICLSVMRVKKNTKGVMLVSASIACLALSLGYILMTRIGLPGVGVGWIAAQTVVAITVVLLLSHRHHRSALTIMEQHPE